MCIIYLKICIKKKNENIPKRKERILSSSEYVLTKVIHILIEKINIISIIEFELFGITKNYEHVGLHLKKPFVKNILDAILFSNNLVLW